MICGTILVETNKKLLKRINHAKRFASLFELRLDKTREKDFEQIFRKIRRPVISTIRKKVQNGYFKLDEKKRMAILKNLFSSDSDFVDVEIETFEKFYSVFKSVYRDKLILSYHNFNRTTETLGHIFNRMKKHKPKYIKIAMYARDAYDNVRLLKQVDAIRDGVKDEEQKFTIFCMGEFGKISRILYKRFGSEFTYGCIAEEKKTAEGQTSIEELKCLYQAEKINQDTKVFVLIGNPVSHSQGPRFFNTIFRKRNIDAVYVPLAIRSSEHLKEIFDAFRISGASVTIPHKIKIMRYLDELTEEAKKCGAVNTIFRKNDKLVGDNFDWCGVYLPLKKTLTKIGREEAGRVLLIGAGGAARAALFALSLLKCKIFAFNRTVSKLNSLQRKFDFEIVKEKDLNALKADVIINATPIGMPPFDKISPINPKSLKKRAIVYDLVYTPKETHLIKQAKAVGCYTISGLEMFRIQAGLQFKVWFKETLSDNELMRLC